MLSGSLTVSDLLGFFNIFKILSDFLPFSLDEMVEMTGIDGEE